MTPSGARCGTHPDVPAVDVCKRCGKFLCGECDELVGEDAYCADCAARVNAPASRVAKASVYVAAFAWLSLGLFFLLLPPLVAPPAALVAMSMAFFEWRRIRRGDSPRRGRRWVLAALLVAAPLFFVMAAFWAYVVMLAPWGQ